MPKINQEMAEKIPGDWWEVLFKQSGGSVALHTVNVCYRTYTNPLFTSECNEFEQNVLMWSALLHDICKRG